MAEIAAIVIQTLQWVGAPVTRQFQYLCCFSRNITSLRNEANQLEDTTQDLRVRVERERNDLQVINREVKTWLQNSNDIKYEKDDILKEVPNVESGCMKLGARFFLSRRAKKTTDRVKELRDRCKLRDDVISQPRAAASTHPIPSGMTYEFESRKQIEKEIMTTVLGRDVNMIGIWGMGGQGKTTMAKRIMNKVLNHGFEAVMAEVGQKVDVSKIQLEIGGSLGLKLEGETSQATVQKLHARLTGGTKRILLVLDNVWETLSPEDIGIPSDYKECTILITSRDRNVLRAMNVQKIFYMEVLSAKDSWIMFRDRVGTCVDNTELNSIAKEVVNECKGLPLALTTVGAALKNEVDVNDWKNSLRQLRKCDPDNSEFIKEVYNPLKLSYDALDPNYQYVFLLCCLYPKGVDIPLEHLTYFCMGLRIFEGGVGNVEEARNRMHALTKVLKSRSLLLDSKNGDGHVRMHDVVRDVCKFIAKKKGYISDDDRSWTSSMQRYTLPSGLGLLRISDSGDEEFKFDGIRDLYALSIEKCSLTSLPFTQRLKNLITLVLDSCGGLETLSVVGKLVNLEILICRRCDSIKELPQEIKGLNRLKVLELTRCKNLQTIGRGIVSSLVGLEELKMLKSFDKWEAEDREERENAGLRELEALTKLSCLEIEIQDPSLAAENIRLSSEVDRFTITYFHSGKRQNVSRFDQYLSKKKMHLNLEEEPTRLGDWIKMQLLRDTECLYLVGNGANNVDLTKPEKLKFLVLGNCKTMKNGVTTSMDDGGGATVFPFIEHLNLFKLAKLQEMCDRGVSPNSFQNLKVIKLDDLPALKQLWKSSRNDLGKDFLPHLEGLDIRDCARMKQVFFWSGEDGNEKKSRHHITKMFPKLKELELRNLPQLISLCQGIEGIEFPLLRKMGILQCGKMKGMVAKRLSSNADTHHLFCESQRVSFGCLKKLQITDGNPFCSHKIHVSLFNGLEKLTISDHAGSLSLFTSSSMAGNLVNLRQLEISLCEEMVEVIKDDEEKGMSGSALLFPKLRTLHLGDLPKLVSFCKWKCDVELPSLRELKIYNCHNMKSCTSGLLTTPNLKSVDLDDHDFGAVKDLNHILQQQYFNRIEKKQAEEAEEEEEEEKKKKKRKRKRKSRKEGAK